ncbi:MAG: prepilin peptidase, partial [Lautropia sp.]|nr:prepilin peptidase [Lautropia sp.]
MTPDLTLVFAAIFGLLIGSFLNVVIHRLPLMMQAQWEAEAAGINEGRADAATAEVSAAKLGVAPVKPEAAAAAPFNLVVPRSRCPHCGHRITALENIPVLSWLLLRGRCSACKARISVRYPLIEVLSGALAFASIWQYGVTLAGVAAACLCFALIALAFIDLDTQLLPDDITLPLLWAGLLLNLAGTFVPLQEAVIGAVAGYL